jgi:hypothetical protein
MEVKAKLMKEKKVVFEGKGIEALKKIDELLK